MHNMKMDYMFIFRFQFSFAHSHQNNYVRKSRQKNNLVPEPRF